MSSSVSIELVTGILRYHPDGKYGDPYTFVCTVLLDNDTAIIKGAVGEYSRDVRERIKEALMDLGVEHVIYERRK